MQALKSTIAWLAFGLVLIAVLKYWPVFVERYVTVPRAEALPQPKPEHKADSPSTSSGHSTAARIVVYDTVKVEPEPVIVAVPQMPLNHGQIAYSVAVQGFTTRAAAESLARTLRDARINNRIIRQQDIYFVTVGLYPDSASAEKMLRRIQSKGYNSPQIITLN